MAGWGPDACGQHPHRARQGALRGTARSARRDGRRGASGRLLADDQGDRRLTTAASKATESARVERTPSERVSARVRGGLDCARFLESQATAKWAMRVFDSVSDQNRHAIPANTYRSSARRVTPMF